MTNNLSIFCILDGYTVSSSFSVEVALGATVDKLKESIKATMSAGLEGVDSNTLTLWKVSIPVTKEDMNKVISLEELTDKEVLLPTTPLRVAFEGLKEGEFIHTIVQSPLKVPGRASITTTFNVSLRSTHMRAFSWSVDVMEASFEDFVSEIYDNFPHLPSSDSPKIILYLNQYDIRHVHDDLSFQAVLLELRNNDDTNIVVDLDTPTLNLSSYSLQSVDTLYGLTRSFSGRLSNFPAFDSIDSIKFNSEEHRVALENLYLDLENRIDTSPLLEDEDIPAFVAPLLHRSVELFKDQLQLKYRPTLLGIRGESQPDFIIETKDYTKEYVIVTKALSSDIGSAVARNMVQLEQTLMRQQAKQQQKEMQARICKKRKRDDHGTNTEAESSVCYGLVTDGSFWHLTECSLEPVAGSCFLYPKFRTSPLGIVTSFQKNRLKVDGTQKAFGTLIWLLDTLMLASNKRRKMK